MSNQTNPPSAIDGGKRFYQANSVQEQIPPPFLPGPDAAALQPLAFPLIRRVSARLQVLGMLSYTLLLIFALTSCLFSLNTQPPDHPDGWLELAYFLQILFLVFVLTPASTLLSALFFGSWRGTLVSCISIYGSILLTHLLNHHFWDNMSPERFLFFIPIFIVTALVGLTYDLRKYANRGTSILTMVIAVPVLVVTFAFNALDPNASLAMDEGGGVFCCTIFFLIPAWVLFAMGIESIIQKVLFSTKQKIHPYQSPDPD
ncbi:hypothetical protein [Dictyobacter formicarum]|uniref:Uncharacterized protein n=1 Tax=Dictyobacter formicarum TaxID=2778368 RepID=A0ABQ3VHY0_9CHLR|nr:hypothetical protein [Dictyobacter formicarum]GHO85799.1 hypothetical protein KSZ_38050 [Dictyobacter formicarum]